MTDAELVKSKIDIVSFISEYTQLKKAGRNFKALCPFHSEKTPSFVVSAERGTWHCFGACAEGGDAIRFLEKWEGIDFLEALKILAKRTGVTLSNYAPTGDAKEKDRLYEINHLSSEFFHYLLTTHPMGKKAREYLKQRNIKDEIIKTFMLGYAPDSWDSLSKFLLKKGYNMQEIETVGLVIKSERGSYYDRFRGRLTFTLYDHRGNIVGFSGRKLPPENEKDLPAGKQEAKYINSPETPLYTKGNTLYGLHITKESIKKENNVVVVEGEFDMLSSFQSGVTNIVAIKGSALTEAQTLLVKRFCDQVSLSLDSDFAGNEAARRGIEIAEGAGLVVKVVRLPFGKDPFECIEKDPHLWKKGVKNTIPIYDFVLDEAVKKYGTTDALAKRNIAAEVIPFLAKISNPIIASHYVKQAAGKLQVTEESIEIAIRNFQRTKTTHMQESKVSSKTVRPREEFVEEHLLSLILQSDDPQESLQKVFEYLQLEDIRQPSIAQIWNIVSLYLKKHSTFDVKEFSKALKPELTSAFDRIYLTDVDAIVTDKEMFSKELKRTALQVKKNSLRMRINDLSTKIRLEEEKGDSKNLAQMQQQQKELIKMKGEIDKSIL